MARPRSPARITARPPAGRGDPAPVGDRPTAAGSRRRREILAAALACFDRRGVSATTIEDIRIASGASIGSIYHHVGGRDAIVAALYLDAVAGYRAGVLEALDGDADRRAALTAVVRFHLGWVTDHPALARLTLHWDEAELGPEGRRRLRSAAARFDAELVAWHRDGVAAGELADMPDDVFAACLLGPLLEVARRLVHRRTPPDPAAVVPVADSLAQRLWCSLTPAGPLHPPVPPPPVRSASTADPGGAGPGPVEERP